MGCTNSKAVAQSEPAKTAPVAPTQAKKPAAAKQQPLAGAKAGITDAADTQRSTPTGAVAAPVSSTRPPVRGNDDDDDDDEVLETWNETLDVVKQHTAASRKGEPWLESKTLSSRVVHIAHSKHSLQASSPGTGGALELEFG